MEENIKECKSCNNTGCLNYKGIFSVYLMAAKFPLLIITVSLLAALICSPYFYILTIAGLIMPLAQADFRMYLYTIALAAKIAGKKLNCPECNPQGSMFRQYDK